jgi:basic amino acid/polyamine antiporter, APA family
MSEFKRSLSLFDAVLLAAGSMVGSGIFIVSADITRNMGSAGGLILVWVITGIMIISAALSYGELSAMYPKAGGMYVYLREAFGELVSFLYGWALFTVIQTGTIAAVGVGFSKFAAYLFPVLSEDNYLIGKPGDFFKFSTAQLTSMLLIVLLTYINTRGVKNGKWVQMIFTIAKGAGLIVLILFGFFLAKNANIWNNNWVDAFTFQKMNFKDGIFVDKTPIIGTFAIISAIAMASVGSVFSSIGFDNITFVAGEIKNPQRNIGLSLFLGTTIVIGIYILANLAYLNVLPLQSIAGAKADRVGVVVANEIFPQWGTILIAVLVMISTFGCINGYILSSARVFYTMANDKLFFAPAGKLNQYGVPENALWYQCIWTCLLCLSGKYGDLLDYVIFAILIFYATAILAIFKLRRKYPNAERPYKAFGYPFVPMLFIIITVMICVPLLIYKPQFTWPGLFLVLLGIPVFYREVILQKINFQKK